MLALIAWAAFAIGVAFAGAVILLVIAVQVMKYLERNNWL